MSFGWFKKAWHLLWRPIDHGPLNLEHIYEGFSDPAKKLIRLTNQEAQRFNHEYIGTEHLLLGLVSEDSGIAAMVLKNLDVDRRKIRLQIEKLVQCGPDVVSLRRRPYTPRARKVIE